MARDKGEIKSVFGNRAKDTRQPGVSADWGSVDGELLRDLIQTVTQRGGAVRFGYSRDGQAYALGLYYGEEHVTKYCRPQEDVDTFLQDWVEFYKGLPVTGGASPSNGSERGK